MSIVTSTYKVGHAQANGRRYVEEFHTDSTGAVHWLEYGPMPDDTDYQAILTARAAVISEQLAQQEAEDLWR